MGSKQAVQTFVSCVSKREKRKGLGSGLYAWEAGELKDRSEMGCN